MKIHYLPLALVLFLALQMLSAQVTEKEENLKAAIKTDSVSGWKTGGVAAVGFSQMSLSNWSAGGENSLSLNTLVNLYARYITPNSEWDNTFDFGYGFLKQSIKGFTKTDDKIEITTKYGKKAFDNFYYSALLNFRTQFFDGFDYKKTPALKISDIMAPGYAVAAIGINYKPSNYFTAFLSPITSKTTFVFNDSLSQVGAFGVNPGKNLREELGGYLRLAFNKNDFKAEILKNVSIGTRLDLFTNYLVHPERVDVTWETLLAMKVNKYLSLSVSTSMIYDYDIKFNGVDKLQFKELLSFAASYTFKNE